MNENIYFVCLLIFLKYNLKTALWVGHSQLISLDSYDVFKRTPVLDEKHASVTGNTMKQSASEKQVQIYYKNKKNKNLKRLMMILM